MTILETRNRLLELLKEATDSGARKIEACLVLNLNIRNLERWVKNKIGDKRSLIEKIPANKLSAVEESEIIRISCSPEYIDKTPNVIVPLLAQKGLYIASESAIYRVLRRAKLLAHRSESRPKRRRSKPRELKATGPDQVYSWDITWLKTNVRGMYFYLYMFMDVWSRKIVGWEIHDTQSAEIAASMISEICTRLNIKSVNLHSDNGGPMTGSTMLATMQNLGVMYSFSRPSVSNDNPYSESLFKTLKYKVGYPEYFADIESAEDWVSNFVTWYNEEHRHSGIKYVTPQERHSGKDKIILASRNQTYLKAKEKHPERWSGNTRNWGWDEIVVLNPDKKKDLVENAA